MGTSRIFVFCILFLTIEGVMLYSLESVTNPLYITDNSQLLNVYPPPQPNFNGSPFAFLDNSFKAAAYAVALSVYVVRLGISLFAYPTLIAGRVMIFMGKYPALLIVNSSVILLLAFAVISRINGGD